MLTLFQSVVLIMYAMPCDSCHDAAKEKNAAIEQARRQAKIRSNEENQAIAICKEFATGEYFLSGAINAIQQHFAIMEIISEL